ncbi:MAG: zinc-binding dehydrogenase [Anaerolineae bacterium]|nr:zinc-binding dehydrogenase [Anaerolineae bacterium]
MVIPRHGPPEVLTLQQGPDPLPKAGEVRVRVLFAGVNFADVAARLGIYPDAPPPPLVVGYEVSGVVDAVGEGVTWAPSEALVMALARFGGYADVLCVPVEQVTLCPPGMPAEHAAALPVNALTAYQMLAVMGRAQPGDVVLIHGAAGGVGWLAVQLARARGARVFGTASASKHAALQALGIDGVIDYHTQDFVEALQDLTQGQGADLILDPIGGGHWLRSYRALAPTGRLILFGQAGMVQGTRRNWRALVRWVLGVPWVAFHPLNLINANKGIMGVNLGHLWDEAPRIRAWINALLELYSAGKLVPHIDQVYPLEEAALAHRRLQEHANIGKVLLRA